MISGNILIRRFGVGVAEQGNTKVLILKDMDSGLVIQAPMTYEEFDKFVTNLKTDRIIEAKVIPHEQIENIKKIREGGA